MLQADDGSDSIDPKRVVQQGYNQVADKYAHLQDEEAWPRMGWLKGLLSRLEPGSSVLDLGCGSGDPADVEIAKEHQVTGVDISEAQIERARKNVPSGNFIREDAGVVDFPRGGFDAVVSFYTLEHIPREEHAAILQRIHQWLRAGGYVLISTEAGEADNVVGEWLDVRMFFSSFDPETIKRMIEAVGFEILETDIETQLEQGTPIPYLWVLARKIKDG